MPTKIPPPIAAYFTSGNKHDIQGMIASFTKDAIVKDESEERRGLDAVREWIEETTRKYRHTVAILDASEANYRRSHSASVIRPRPLTLPFNEAPRGRRSRARRRQRSASERRPPRPGHPARRRASEASAPETPREVGRRPRRGR